MSGYPIYNHDENTITLGFEQYANLVRQLGEYEQTLHTIGLILNGGEEE
tara:strand:+ start:155 stop:301 length:147 start_codon:yes stop_codon:yes gene_type:complete